MTRDVSFQFLNPEFLAALVLVPLAVWSAMRVRRIGRPTLVYSDLAPMQGLRPTWRMRADALLPWMRGLALALGIVALARPQLGTVERNVRTLGVDIVLAIDTSGSMQAMDLEPNRLEAAKAAATDFVSRRRYDRIAVVLFGESAALLCPPTFDHDAVKMFIAAIRDKIIKGGSTAIGSGLALATSKLKDSPAKSRVVVLLTDGVNNSGIISPLQAAEAAKALGVRVYTIGVGGDRETLARVRDEFGRITTRPFEGVDSATLTKIAEMTGGRYFQAKDNESLQSVYKEIDRLERTELEVDETADYEERFLLLWGPALLLLGLETLLRALVLRRIP
jgi:Ca-activated chloride channel family protein